MTIVHQAPEVFTLSRGRRQLPALGFLTLLISLLNSVLLVVQTVLVNNNNNNNNNNDNNNNNENMNMNGRKVFRFLENLIRATSKMSGTHSKSTVASAASQAEPVEK